MEPVHHLSQNPVIRQNVACNNKVIFNEMLDQSAILATAKDAAAATPVQCRQLPPLAPRICRCHLAYRLRSVPSCLHAGKNVLAPQHAGLCSL